jgi:hypothetical protein
MEPQHDDQLLAACGIDDLDELALRCQQVRRDLGQPSARWATRCLAAALHLAVIGRGWPAPHAVAALLTVAADPATRSPMRLAEAGPWWDSAERMNTVRAPNAPVDPTELSELEAQLDAQDGRRVLLQRTAREQLTAEGQVLTRVTVLRRAAQILNEPDQP